MFSKFIVIYFFVNVFCYLNLKFELTHLYLPVNHLHNQVVVCVNLRCGLITVLAGCCIKTDQGRNACHFI